MAGREICQQRRAAAFTVLPLRRARLEAGFRREIVALPSLLTHSLFGGSIPRRLLLRGSPVKSTSAPLRYGWLHGTKPRFGARPHPAPQETHRGAGVVRHATSTLQFFRPVSQLLLLPQALRKYGPLDTERRPLVLGRMEAPKLSRLPDDLVFRPRSTRGLPQCYRKRSAPNPAEQLRQAEKFPNSGALKVQSHRMPTVLHQKRYAQGDRESLQTIVSRLKRAYYSTLESVTMASAILA